MVRSWFSPHLLCQQHVTQLVPPSFWKYFILNSYQSLLVHLQPSHLQTRRTLCSVLSSLIYTHFQGEREPCTAWNITFLYISTYHSGIFSNSWLADSVCQLTTPQWHVLHILSCYVQYQAPNPPTVVLSSVKGTLSLQGLRAVFDPWRWLTFKQLENPTSYPLLPASTATSFISTRITAPWSSWFASHLTKSLQPRLSSLWQP